MPVAQLAPVGSGLLIAINLTDRCAAREPKGYFSAVSVIRIVGEDRDIRSNLVLGARAVGDNRVIDVGWVEIAKVRD